MISKRDLYGNPSRRVCTYTPFSAQRKDGDTSLVNICVKNIIDKDLTLSGDVSL
jgi:hypothetical protein